MNHFRAMFGALQCSGANGCEAWIAGLVAFSRMSGDLFRVLVHLSNPRTTDDMVVSQIPEAQTRQW